MRRKVSTVLHVSCFVRASPPLLASVPANAVICVYTILSLHPASQYNSCHSGQVCRVVEVCHGSVRKVKPNNALRPCTLSGSLSLHSTGYRGSSRC